MAFFDINYDTLIPQLLPVRLRLPVTIAWLKALVSPTKWLHSVFKQNRKSNLYDLRHNGQVCFLEAVLNDAFDPVARGIFITDGAFRDPLFTYLDTELKPLWLGLQSEAGTTPYPDPEVLFTEAECYVLGICFIVNVPAVATWALSYDVVRLRALIDKYRLPGRTNYTIQVY